MEYYGLSDKKQYLFGKQYQEMAFGYWGPGNLPQGAQIVGGYSDKNRAGALIHLFTGTPGGIRTPDTRIRSPVLYPAELRVHWL
jgi:hypothetical protein